MKHIYFLILLSVFISCKETKTNKATNTESTFRDIERDTINNDSLLREDATIQYFTNLPIGSQYVSFNFTETVATSDKNDKKINAIVNSVYKIEEVKPERIFDSKKEIKGTQYLKRAFSDRNSKIIETIYSLPNKYGLNISIEKISKKYNPNNNTESIYCLSLYKNDKIISRNIIGYIYYGDLVESYKVWFIDNEYVINTRIITGVAGNEESYVSELIKFTISESGQFVRYFNQENTYFKNLHEEGKIKNHLKEGAWSEKEDYNGYIDDSAYISTKYNKGLPFGTWNYYNLIDNGKKGNKLLMTEEYDSNGKLLKRVIMKK